MIPFGLKCDYVKGVCVITGGRIIECKMPADAVSLITTGIGVGVLAGIISGVWYVLAQAVGNRTRFRKKSEWYCEICGTYLHSTVNILNDDLVICAKCGAKVCTQNCSKFVQHTKWVCKNCLNPSGSWFRKLMNAVQPNCEDSFGAIMNSRSQSSPELDALRKLDKEQVRDFIEKLVNVMLGENVDNASVSLLYNNNHYKRLFIKYHEDLSNTLTDLGSALNVSMCNLPVHGQTPCTAHAALKQLIEKLLKEAVNLPLLEKARSDSATPPEDTADRTYEDLLATAIINKVVTSSQNNLPSSSGNSVSSRISCSSRNRTNKEYFFGEETLDSKWKTTDLDTSSVSSLEEWLQCDSSVGSNKYVDKLTLMIKQDIEQVDDLDSEEDDAEYFKSSSSIFNDSESNWFLQRRQFQGTNSPVPVPMLVPNPSADAKVLIGDKPLDDTSDLSDVGSDYEESIQPTTAHTLLIHSKNIIGGGKSKLETNENADVQSESSTDSGVKEVNGHEQKTFDAPEVVKTDISLDDDNVEDSSFISVYSNTEKEAEYTEKYASLPRQIQIARPSSPQKSKIVENGNLHSKPEENGHEGDFHFISGTYSKREKEKWSHAVPMKNNPYSKENIERRIKRSSSAAGSIFGPDYYARRAGKPSGGGKLLTSEINGVSWPPSESALARSPSPPPELPKVLPPSRESIPSEEALIISSPVLDHPPEPPKTKPPPRSFIESDFITPPELPKSQPPPRELIIETDGIHQALKAIVTPDAEIMPLKMAYQESKSEHYHVRDYEVALATSEVTTSDSDLSYVNYYDVEHSQIVRKSQNENVHIPITSTPIGVSYKSIEKSKTDFVKETPVARPRVLNAQTKKENGLYVKATSVTNQRSIISTNGEPVLRRNLSESNLIDTSQKATNQKKDNTLISKIYKDPKVRLFALNSREDVFAKEGEYVTPPVQRKRSVDAKLIQSESSSFHLSKGRSYSSDDGLTSEYESGKTGKMSFFSSEEDLLSLNSESTYSHGEITATRNKDVKYNDSPNRRTPSPGIPSTPRTPSTKHFIYGSQEDLLSIDELSSLPRRKDNTIVSKIYKDPNVRNFALKTHRDIITDVERAVSPKPRKVSSSDEEHYFIDNRKILADKQKYGSYDLSSAEISLESQHNNINNNKLQHEIYSQQVDGSENGYKSDDLDIDEIAKRHVVRQALGKFSHSEANLKNSFYRSTSVEDMESIRVSVRDLRKKFESNNSSSKPVVSSLTARSLSKQVKDSLKK